MLEIRVRVLDALGKEIGPTVLLGIAEELPDVLVHATAVEQEEQDLVTALEEHPRRLMGSEATRVLLNDFPAVRVRQIQIGPR